MKRFPVMFLISLLLFSCSDSSSLSESSSSSSSSYEENIIESNDYCRKGEITSSFSFSLLNGLSLGSLSYSSPIEYHYGVNEFSKYTNNFDLVITPSEGADSQANYQYLSAVFALAEYFDINFNEESTTDMFVLLSDHYKNIEESSSQKLILSSLDSQFYCYGLNGDDLSAFYQQENEEDSTLTDLISLLEKVGEDNIDINLVELLSYLKENSSSFDSLKRILALITDIAYIVGEGLEVRVTPRENDCSVSIFLNDSGLQRLHSFFSSSSYMNIISDVNEVRLDFDIFNNEIINNQLGDISLNFDLEINDSLAVSFDLDASINRESELIENGYFELEKENILNYQTFYEDEFEPFFNPIHNYVDFDLSILSMIPIDNIDTSKISISSKQGDILNDVISLYQSLSTEAKNMLPSIFEEEDYQTLILNEYQKGIGYIDQALEDFKGEVSSDNVDNLFSSLSTYKDWEQGVIDKGGEELLNSLYNYIDNTFKEASFTLEELDSKIDTFALNNDSDSFDDLANLYRSIQTSSFLPNSTYCTGERLNQYEELSSLLEDEDQRILLSLSAYVRSIVNSDTDFTDLYNLVSSSSYQTLIYNHNLERSDARMRSFVFYLDNKADIIDEVLDSYSSNILRELLTNYKEMSSLNFYSYVISNLSQKIINIDFVSSLLLGDTSYTETIKEIVYSLLNISL